MNEELNDIITGCLSNNRGCQEKLYNLYYTKMMSVIQKYVDCPYNAEEILNNGFLRAFKNISKFGNKGSFDGWLRKIMFHAVADYIRANKKYIDKTVISDFNRVLMSENEKANSNINFDNLIKLVDELPKATLNVFYLYVMYGYTHVQIASMLDISEGTSKWHLSSGRAILQNKVNKLQKA